MLGNAFGTETENVTKNRLNGIMESFMVVTLRQTLFEYSRWVDHVARMVKIIQGGFMGKPEVRDALLDQTLDGRIKNGP